MADSSGRFRLNIDDFNATYKGLDQTYDIFVERMDAAVSKAGSVSPEKAGGRILGVVEGVRSGKERAHNKESGTMHYALGALKNRTGHLMNGMNASLKAYSAEDELHANNYGVIDGTGGDPAAGRTTEKSYTTSTTAPVDPSKLPKIPGN